MSAYLVTLRSGKKYTIAADDVRSSNDGMLELLAAGNRVVAVFDRGDVACVVARDHLLAEETGDPVPYSVGHNTAIPF